MRQLEIIEEIFALAAEAEIPLWLRGGWAMDFALGEVTREHLDIDLFAWAVDAERLTRVLTDNDYDRVPNDHPLLQLDFSPARRGRSTSAWSPAPPPGRSLCPHGESAGKAWPEGMLDGPPGRIGRSRVPDGQRAGTDKNQRDDAYLGTGNAPPGEGQARH